MAEELRRLGWKVTDLAGRRKSDPGKLAVAAQLRKETTLPLKWIAARVRLGASKSASAKLHLWMQANPTSLHAGARGGREKTTRTRNHVKTPFWVDPFSFFSFSFLCSKPEEMVKDWRAFALTLAGMNWSIPPRKGSIP